MVSEVGYELVDLLSCLIVEGLWFDISLTTFIRKQEDGMTVRTISDGEHSHPHTILGIQFKPCYLIFQQWNIISCLIHQGRVIGNVIRDNLVIDCCITCLIEYTGCFGVEDAISAYYTRDASLRWIPGQLDTGGTCAGRIYVCRRPGRS